MVVLIVILQNLPDNFASKLTDIEIYSISEELSNQIWGIVRHWPYFEKETLGKQLVRAADSISANIAEAFGRYHYKDCQKFGYYARGSFKETRSWLRKSYQRKRLTDRQVEMINTYIEQIGPKLNSLINTFKNPLSHT
jgi:four helix bundle protein